MIKPVLVRYMIHARRDVPFYNQIDLAAIEDDIVIGVSGNMTVGYKLNGINLMLKSRQEQVSAVEFLSRSLGHLPEKTQYQFVIRNIGGAGKALYDYRDGISSINDFSKSLIESKFNHLKGDTLFHHEFYLFVTKIDDDKQNLAGKLSFMNKKGETSGQEEFAARKEELLSAKSHLENVFNNLKIGITLMKEEDLKTFFYFHLNPTRAWIVRPGNIGLKPVHNITLRSTLLYSAPVVERDYHFQISLPHGLSFDTILKIIRRFVPG